MTADWARLPHDLLAAISSRIATVSASFPSVPSTTTLSGWPSPVVPPRVPARLRSTSVTSVPVRSSDRDRVGAAERVEGHRSTPWVSIVMFPGVRKRSRSPFADRSTVSARRRR